MSEKTKIAFADSTVNPIVGCDGCPLWVPSKPTTDQSCYAAKMVERRGHRDDGSKVKGWPKRFNEVEYHPHRLEQALRLKDLTGAIRPDKPWLNGMPRVIFVNDLGDTFTPSIPQAKTVMNEWRHDHWLKNWLPEMAAAPHIWLVFTKQAKRMRQFFELVHCPPNVWPVVSAINQEMANRNIPELLAIDSTVHGISYEPIWGPVDFSRWLPDPMLRRPNWIIAGGESGGNRRDGNSEYAAHVCIEMAVHQCHAAGMACFVKQDCASAPGEQGRIPYALWSLKQFPNQPTKGGQ